MSLNQLIRVWHRRSFLEKVIKTAESLLRNNDINSGEYNVIKYVAVHFYVKAIKLAKGIFALCNINLSSDSKILLRSLFEVARYCEYILIDLKDIKRAENIIAVSFIEDKTTEDKINKYGCVDIDKMAIDDSDKDFLKNRVPQRKQIREDNYSYIVDRLRKRSPDYVSLSSDEIFNKEGIKNRFFLEEVNQKFNEETKTKDFWKRYHVILYRDCSDSTHALDFETNVMRENEKLQYKLYEREKIAETILSATTTFLIRILDISNTIFDFKADNEIKKLLNEVKKLP
jgi:hypothetical protein